MPIHIHVARSPLDLEAIYTLRARDSGLDPAPEKGAVSTGQLVDVFDTFDSTTNLLIRDGRDPIGALRVAEMTERGLPGDAAFDFANIRPHLKGKVMGVDRVFLIRGYRSHPGILIAAMKMAVQVVRTRGAEHLLVITPQELTPHFDGIGLSLVGRPAWLEEEDRTVMPMYAGLSHLQSPFVEWLQNPIFDPIGAFLRRSIYSKDEPVFREGSIGRAGHVVTRGSVVITTRDQEDNDVIVGFLGPGEVFGEGALLEATPRLASVTAFGEETDLVSLDRSSFRKYIFDVPERTRAVVQLFARHELHNNEGVVARSRDTAVLLVRVIRDAARAAGIESQGLLHGTNLEWLAGRVGRAPELVGQLTSVLERRGLMALRSEGLWVHDVHAISRCLEDLIRENHLHRKRRQIEKSGKGGQAISNRGERLVIPCWTV